MKTLKFTSKKAQEFIRAYMNSEFKDINQVYKTFSHKKAFIQNYYTGLMKFEGGFGFRIISWNSFFFTCAWRWHGGLRVETYKMSYFINDYSPF